MAANEVPIRRTPQSEKYLCREVSPSQSNSAKVEVEAAAQLVHTLRTKRQLSSFHEDTDRLIPHRRTRRRRKPVIGRVQQDALMPAGFLRMTRPNAQSLAPALEELFIDLGQFDARFQRTI